MTEIEDRMGVWGAIDQAVVDNPEEPIDGVPLAELVGRYLGPYNQGGAGWFGEFTAWTEELTHVAPAEQYPPLDLALSNLADRAPVGREQARRLHALAVAARVFPVLREPDHELHPLVIGAIAQLCPEPDNFDTGEQLLNLVCNDDLFPDLGAWEVLLVTASDAGLITSTLLIQATAPPCSGELVTVVLPGGDPDPVPTLSTGFCTDQLTIEQAKRFLEPSNWPNCNDLWCTMVQTGTSAQGNPTYREVVSVDCNNPNAWQAETFLEFVMAPLPDDGALVSYNLCDGLPQQGDPILVDSGSLVVVQQGNEVCVSTTKRILFDHPFSGPSLAALSCALGYGAVAEDLVFTCAVAPENQNTGAGTDFPGVGPSEPADGAAKKASKNATKKAAKAKKGKKAKKAKEKAPAGDDCDAMQGVVDDAVDAAKTCIDDYVAMYKKSFAKVTAGRYSANDAMQDMAVVWTRLLRDGATAFDLGMRASRAAANTSASRRASDATAPEPE